MITTPLQGWIGFDYGPLRKPLDPLPHVLLVEVRLLNDLRHRPARAPALVQDEQEAARLMESSDKCLSGVIPV